MTSVDHVKFAAPSKTLFYPTLKRRVDQYFLDHNKSKYANGTMVFKAIILISAYIVPYILLILFTPVIEISLLLWLIMGMAISGIGMSVMHDANHGAFSANPRVNKWLGYTINLAGAGAVNWKLQHNILHHTYTNVAGKDEDIKDRGVVKLSPHEEVGKLHRFQWWYAFFFYGILTLYWVVLKDFFQYKGFIKSGVNRQKKSENRAMLIGLVRMKVVYFVIFFLVPVFIFDIAFVEILTGFLLMHFVAGLVLTVIFQLAHSVEAAKHPLPDENGIIEKDWAVHQLETTVNFSPRNAWLSWYIGGLNFQIEHHLFPKICHVHYPELSPIVKMTAKEFGLEYLENPTLITAIKSHIVTLKRFGLPSANEAIV